MNGLIAIFLASCAGATFGMVVALLVRRCSEHERRRLHPPHAHIDINVDGLLWTLDKPTGRPMTWRDPR